MKTYINDPPPAAIQEALQKGIEYFMSERCEWKLEVKPSPPFIEDLVGVRVFIFANNGFGDYLFLKSKSQGTTFEEEVFEFFHEGPEICHVDEDLRTLLGLQQRLPSTDAYPAAVYETGEPVLLGDHVKIKVWAQFWKGWQDGLVEYVPGISNRNLEHEYGGLKWVAVKFHDGQICPLVDPKTGILKKVKFVSRQGSNYPAIDI